LVTQRLYNILCSQLYSVTWPTRQNPNCCGF